MCGLIYAKRAPGLPVEKIIRKRYKKQSSRGTQGYGYIPVEDGYIRRVERARTEVEIMEKLKKETTNEIMFHHRLPTSASNFVGTTHPIVVKNDQLEFDYYVCHNGSVTNTDVLKKRHEDQGFFYTTEYELEKRTQRRVTYLHQKDEKLGESFEKESKHNDSESLAIELALVLEGKRDELNLSGGIAFFAYKTDKEGKVLELIYGRNANKPLVVEYVNTKKKKKKKKKGNSSNLFVLKSEGGGQSVPMHMLHRLDAESAKLTVTEMDIGYRVQSAYNTSSTGYGRDPIPSQRRLIEPPEKQGIGFSNNNEDDKGNVGGYHKRTSELDEIDDMLGMEFSERVLSKLERASDSIQEQIIDKKTECDIYKSDLIKPEAERESMLSELELKTYIDELETEISKLTKEWQEVQEQMNEMELGNLPSPYSDDIVRRHG